MSDIAISTLAASVFGLVSMSGPAPFAQAVVALQGHGYDASMGEYEAATNELLNRDMVTLDGAVLVSRYPQGWVMSLRDREDPTGWAGWVMKYMPTGEHRPIDELRKVDR